MLVFDSNGRLRPGISSGSLFNSVGDYDQCRHRVRNERSVLETKYCLAQIDLSSKANQLSELTGQSKSLFAPIGGRFAKIGLCLPKNCKPEDIVTFGDHLLNSSFHDDHLFVNRIECGFDELKNSQSFSVTLIITLIVLVFFIASSTTATILDLSGFKENKKQKSNRRRKFIVAIDWFIRIFSLYSGYKTLITPRKILYSRKLNLKVLDGLKVISMLWIIVIHSYNFGFQWLLFDNLNKVDNVYKEAWIQWVANGTFSVDNFFLISGFLTWLKCLNIIGFMRGNDKSALSNKGVRKRRVDCKEVKVLNSSESETSLSFEMDSSSNRNGDKWLNMMKVFSSNLLIRYFRLAPTMMFLILISVSLLPILSWAPNWSNATIMFDEWCRYNWYINIFLLQNFINTPNMCFSHSWYLAVDFQLFIIINLIIILICFTAKTTNVIRLFFYTKYILISGIIIVQLLIATFIYHLKLPSAPIVPVDSLDSMINYYASFYIKPYYWLTSYFIGSLLAMCIISLTFKEANIVEVRRERRSKKSRGIVSIRVKNLISIIQVVSPCTLIALILSTLPYFQNTYKMVGTLSSLHALLARPLWSFCLASILFTILQTKSRFFNSRNNFIYKMIQAFLSLKLWLPLSKLTYSVYLFHPLVMAIFYGSRKETFKFSHSLLLYFSLGNIVLTYFGSLFIYLTIELPIQVTIEQMILILFPICEGIRKKKASNNKQLSSTGTLTNDISMVERGSNFLTTAVGSLSNRHEQRNNQGRTTTTS